MQLSIIHLGEKQLLRRKRYRARRLGQDRENPQFAFPITVAHQNDGV